MCATSRRLDNKIINERIRARAVPFKPPAPTLNGQGHYYAAQRPRATRRGPAELAPSRNSSIRGAGGLRHRPRPGRLQPRGGPTLRDRNRRRAALVPARLTVRDRIGSSWCFGGDLQLYNVLIAQFSRFSGWEVELEEWICYFSSIQSIIEGSSTEI